MAQNWKAAAKVFRQEWKEAEWTAARSRRRRIRVELDNERLIAENKELRSVLKDISELYVDGARATAISMALHALGK